MLALKSFLSCSDFPIKGWHDEVAWFRKTIEKEHALSDNVSREVVGRGGRRRRKMGRVEREGSRRVRIVVRRRRSTSSESDQCNANDTMDVDVCLVFFIKLDLMVLFYPQTRAAKCLQSRGHPPPW